MLGENKAIAYRFLDGMWNNANFNLVEDLVHVDYDGHSSTEVRGQDGAVPFIMDMHKAFPDFQFTIEDQIAEGDKVVSRWTASGTHQKEFWGIPATNRTIRITGITIFRIRDGMLVDGWTNEDIHGFLQQLGAIPTP